MTDDIDRRGFLRCMAWAGTAAVWTVSGGVLSGCGIGQAQAPAQPKTRDLYFVQISDSHIGFRGAANQDVTGTFGQAIAQVNALPSRPAFVMHTGDLTHTSTPEQFNTVKELLGTLKSPQVIVVNSSSQYRTLADLLNDARAKPDVLSIASEGRLEHMVYTTFLRVFIRLRRRRQFLVPVSAS